MRRNDKEITDVAEIIQIIDKYKVLRVGMYTPSEGVYIVPLNFGYAYRDNKLTLYFHSAKTGRKNNMLAENSKVCFEIDGNYLLLPSHTPCKFSNTFESVIGNGMAVHVTEIDEKKLALNLILKRHQKGDTIFTDNAVETVAVYKIMVDLFTCKSKQ